MPVILKNEWKSGWKSLLIWALSVGGMGLICGRKAFQRPMAEGIELINTIQDVYLDKEISLA